MPATEDIPEPNDRDWDASDWECGIFWDLENIHVPRNFDTHVASNKLGDIARQFGRICSRRLYYDSRKPTEANVDRVNLDNAGWTVVDCPTHNAKEVVDKKIIVDMMSFAWERIARKAKVCVILISSDGDFSYMLNRLRDQQVHVGVIHGPNVSEMLLQSADWHMNWRHDVLCLPPSVKPAAVATPTSIATPSRPAPSSLSTTDCAANRLRQLQLTTMPTMQRSFSKEAAVREDGKYVTLLVTLVEAQKKTALRDGQIDWQQCWALEGTVCVEFYKKDGMGNADKAKRKSRYQACREGAIDAGFVERRQRQGQCQYYLRVTQKGLGPTIAQQELCLTDEQPDTQQERHAPEMQRVGHADSLRLCAGSGQFGQYGQSGQYDQFGLEAEQVQAVILESMLVDQPVGTEPARVQQDATNAALCSQQDETNAGLAELLVVGLQQPAYQSGSPRYEVMAPAVMAGHISDDDISDDDNADDDSEDDGDDSSENDGDDSSEDDSDEYAEDVDYQYLSDESLSFEVNREGAEGNEERNCADCQRGPATNTGPVCASTCAPLSLRALNVPACNGGEPGTSGGTRAPTEWNEDEDWLPTTPRAMRRANGFSP
jgi:hypothetical protein